MKLGTMTFVMISTKMLTTTTLVISTMMLTTTMWTLVTKYDFNWNGRGWMVQFRQMVRQPSQQTSGSRVV
jgi:hypothetical protein